MYVPHLGYNKPLQVIHDSQSADNCYSLGTINIFESNLVQTGTPIILIFRIDWWISLNGSFQQQDPDWTRLLYLSNERYLVLILRVLIPKWHDQTQHDTIVFNTNHRTRHDRTQYDTTVLDSARPASTRHFVILNSEFYSSKPDRYIKTQVCPWLIRLCENHMTMTTHDRVESDWSHRVVSHQICLIVSHQMICFIALCHIWIVSSHHIASDLSHCTVWREICFITSYLICLIAPCHIWFVSSHRVTWDLSHHVISDLSHCTQSHQICFIAPYDMRLVSSCRIRFVSLHHVTSDLSHCSMSHLICLIAARHIWFVSSCRIRFVSSCHIRSVSSCRVTSDLSHRIMSHLICLIASCRIRSCLDVLGVHFLGIRVCIWWISIAKVSERDL